MMTQANVVIIGGGISGASIAYHLAEAGVKDIVVLEKHYMTYGATGRCGAGVRQQWGTRMNCLLAKKSVAFFEKAQEILAYDGDIEFKQEGYLIVASDEAEAKTFAAHVALQNSLGIPARVCTKEEARAIVPHLNTDAIHSATFCPTDGHLNPFTMTDAFFKAAKRLGVHYYDHTAVTDIRRQNGQIEGVMTQHGFIKTNTVVNAAGGWAKDIGAMVGLDIPVYSRNHEILVTEPVEKMQGPMVISFSKNIYCQQTPHGAFIMGRGDKDAPKGLDMGSSWQFLEAMAKTVSDLLPPVGELRVIRQWGGLYNMSPDHQPIISASRDVPGFYIACGFSGHGFMLAPMTGLLIREMILGQTPSMPLEALSLERFEGQEIEELETSVV
ncbi:MAG: FAD-binding oxidoreductase [Acholeplasmatales bacterium]|nr:MAG: FAD-binding oxidoreductase [Acholeplasmatales bacterium]